MVSRTRSRPILLVLAAALLAVGFASGYAIARRTSDVGAPAAADAPSDAITTSERSRAGAAPSWAPTAGETMPTVGSIFRNRYATAESPLDGMEAVLLSPRDDECLDDCPLALRFVRKAAGAKAVGAVVGSLGPNLRALAAAPGLPPRLAEWIHGAATMFDPHAGRTPGEEAQQPLRALFIGMPRPDVAPSTWSVGLAIYDGPDSHFDRDVTTFAARPSGRILVSRLETDAGSPGRPRLLAGAIEVAPVRRSRGPRPIPENASEIGSVFGSLWGHFQSLPAELGGLYLARDGAIYAYGPDLAMHRLPADPQLAHALRIVLLRA